MEKYEEIKGYYDDYGSWYDDERIEGYYSFINDIEVEVVRKYGVGKKTLEIGCGTGIIQKRVSKFAGESWGVDLSSGMLEVARSKGLNVKQANATQLPFKDNEFDICYSFKVLAHIPEINKVIDEILRVTKPDGVVILEFYNPLSFKYLTNRLANAFKKVFTRYDSMRDIKKMFGDRFDVVEFRGARIITPVAFVMKIPVLNTIIVVLEKYFSTTLLNRFAGYFIVVANPTSANK